MTGLRSFLYLLARFLGDLNALHRGPRAFIKRQARKTLYRAAGRSINRFTR